jgi:putative nucleotidyltransferase with HDIG domain
MDRVAWAQDLAERLLAEPLSRRWSHVQGVGRKAESIAHIVGEDAEILICAAWLHDIGYASGLAMTGLHALDGARYLRDIERADDRLCRLVAHHSCAVIEARNRGLSDVLVWEFPAVDGILSDALTYCDMTTSPDGNPIDVEARLAEIVDRYGAGNLIAESIREAAPKIKNSVKAIRHRSIGPTIRP